MKNGDIGRLISSLTILCACQTVQNSGITPQLRPVAPVQAELDDQHSDSNPEMWDECSFIPANSSADGTGCPAKDSDTVGGADVGLPEMQSLLTATGLPIPQDDRNTVRLYPIAKAIQNVTVQSQGIPLSAQRQAVVSEFISRSAAFASVANEQYESGQPGSGDAYLILANFTAQAAVKLLDPGFTRSLLTSVGPGAMVRDFYEASTGRSIVSGSPLTRVDRSVALVSFATGGVASTVFKKAKTVDRITGMGSMLRTAAENSGHSSDDLGPVVERAQEIFANIDAATTRVEEVRDAQLQNVSSYLSSEAIKMRLEKMRQNATKFIGR